MTDKQKITSEEWAKFSLCMELIGEYRPKENSIIVSNRTYEKMVELGMIDKKVFKIGKWNNK